MTLPGIDELTTLVQEVLAEILEVPADEIPLGADLIDELAVDSLHQLELMTRVEQRLELPLDADDWRNGRSVLELAERLRLRLTGQRPE